MPRDIQVTAEHDKVGTRLNLLSYGDLRIQDLVHPILVSIAKICTASLVFCIIASDAETTLLSLR